MAKPIHPNASALIDEYIARQDVGVQKSLVALRKIIRSAHPELKEDWKWNAPIFNVNGMVCWLVSFKEHIGINFYHGALIEDIHHVFEQTGIDKKSNRIIKYKSFEDIDEQILLHYLREAIQNNLDGLKPAKRIIDTELPDYLEAELQANSSALAFFNSLPNGAKRDYIEWITEAKRESTRTKRMQTMMEWLSEGKKRHWKYENC